MHPELFTIGPFTLRSFGLMLALGFLAAFLALRVLLRGTGRNSDYASTLLVWCMAAGVAGARIAYVMEHWSTQFRDDPGTIFRIDQGGLMYYGGMIGALLALFLFARIHREHVLDVLDQTAGVLPLGQAFGRIGCFLNGCCYGRLCDSFGVAFPRGSAPWYEQVRTLAIGPDTLQSLPVVPVQLLESAGCALLFLFLWGLHRKKRRGLVTGAYLVGYGLLRFALEFLRGDERLMLGAFSIGQTISLAAILAGIVLLAVSLAATRDEAKP
jgi:phosphatidylglycerol:prolipoprotein diacylglycerol transferase